MLTLLKYYESLVDQLNNIREDASSYFVEIPLPGFKRHQVKARLDGDVILVEAKKDGATVSRAVQLGDAIDEGKITTKLEDGILTITLPKKTKSGNRTRDLPIE